MGGRNAADNKRLYAIRWKLRALLGLPRGTAAGGIEKMVMWASRKVWAHCSDEERREVSADIVPEWLDAETARTLFTGAVPWPEPPIRPAGPVGAAIPRHKLHSRAQDLFVARRREGLREAA